ncbi:MAG: hypothetical protein K5755_01195 [Clostridiales bacterium]|nr:hypothetical protein [Clostridia bacterium]MCR4563238.1 hypothetical protein [Clostridiales bacterium]
MKQPAEIHKILKAFFLCVIISLCLMFAFMGFFRAQSNSEYALNGKKGEYVTAPWYSSSIY